MHRRSLLAAAVLGGTCTILFAALDERRDAPVPRQAVASPALPGVQPGGAIR
jgi:hypothetical protein